MKNVNYFDGVLIVMAIVAGLLFLAEPESLMLNLVIKATAGMLCYIIAVKHRQWKSRGMFDLFANVEE